MKSKLLLLCIFGLGIICLCDKAQAEPAIIKDIVVETVGASVKISITASQTLQIETFKNDDSPANYIVLDFLGTVYTNLDQVIEVGSGPVEKVSLVRGEEKQIKVMDEDYYSLDFLAINLSTTADYFVRQSKSVIDLSIGATAGVVSENPEYYAAKEKAVELTPPIVVAKQTEPEQEPSQAASEGKSGFTFGNESKKESVVEEKTIKDKKKKRGLFKIFAKKKKDPVPVTPQEEKAPVYMPRQEVPVRAERPVYQKPRSSQEAYLIDQVVEETARAKEQAAARIEDITSELRRMQEELNLSKGKKSEIEDKINQIPAKLDQLKDALDEEIKRRQALGEKVEDLVAKREEYMKVKAAYEDMEQQFAQVSTKVDGLNAEVNSLKGQIDALTAEKQSLEAQAGKMTEEYGQAKNSYNTAVNDKNALDLRIDKLNRELENMRKTLDQLAAERSLMEESVRNLELKTRYGDEELRRLKQSLIDKNSNLLELGRRYDQLKVELEASVAEKFKIDYSYRNAKTEFERVKREIEGVLENK